jgi:hypothetical protein
MDNLPTFEPIAFPPGLEATQGTNVSPYPYRTVSFAPEYESDQWIKVSSRKGKRRNKKSAF